MEYDLWITFSKDYNFTILRSINVCDCRFEESKDQLLVKFPNQLARDHYSQTVENLRLNPWQKDSA